MKRSEARDLFMPWAGLAVGLAALAIVHQFGSDGVFDDCALVSPLPLILVALLGMVATVVAALASWRIASDDDEGPARRLVGMISVCCAAFFVLAMALPVIASLMLPPCFQ